MKSENIHMNLRKNIITSLLAITMLSGLSGCLLDTETGLEEHDHSELEYPAPEMYAFAVKFALVADGKMVGCGDALTGFGDEGTHTVALNDARMYISNLQLYDAQGNTGTVMLAHNVFQLHDDAGQVNLIDLTDKSEGACKTPASQAPEGTSRVNYAVTGTTTLAKVARVSFDVGVPQPLMKAVVANHSTEDAPSPLAEMYWSWASGYRHFVLNIDLEDEDGAKGEGHIHIGSTGCTSASGVALADSERCDKLNTARVDLQLDPDTDAIGLDLTALLEDLDMLVYSAEGTPAVGAACHANPMEPDCPLVFDVLGLDDAGEATAADNVVFVVLEDMADSIDLDMSGMDMMDDDTAMDHSNH